MQIIRYIKESEHIDQSIKDKVDDLPGTTLIRIFGSSPIQDALEITVNNGVVETQLPPSEFAKGISTIAKDVIDRTVTSRTLDTSEHRADYAEKIRKTSRIDYSKRQPSKTPLKDLADANPLAATSVTPPSASASVKRATASSSAVSDRKELIPKKIQLPIPASYPRIQLIFKELKTLKIDTYPNAVGVLFRVFIEMSADAYVSKHIPSLHSNSDLQIKVDSTCKHMISQAILTKHEVKPIQTATSAPHSIFSMNTFNAYVHNPHMTPKKTEMIHTWNDFGVFLQKLWENI